MMIKELNIKSFQGGYDDNLCYLLWCIETLEAAIIDPSVNIGPIIKYIDKKKLKLKKILITHTHLDHIAYLDDFNILYPNLTICVYENPQKLLNIKYKPLKHLETLSIGKTLLTCLYTPGHYIDSMCFWSKKEEILFTGDTMFVGRTGRVISQTSSIEQLYKSVYKILLKLPHETIIYPGHNYGFKKNISIKENIRLSDFFKCKTFKEFEYIMNQFEKNR